MASHAEAAWQQRLEDMQAAADSLNTTSGSLQQQTPSLTSMRLAHEQCSKPVSRCLHTLRDLATDGDVPLGGKHVGAHVGNKDQFAQLLITTALEARLLTGLSMLLGWLLPGLKGPEQLRRCAPLGLMHLRSQSTLPQASCTSLCKPWVCTLNYGTQVLRC